MDRRTFLRVAGVSAAGAVAAACSTPGSGPSVPSSSGVATTGPSGTPAPAGPPDWAALKSRLSGGLVLPGESGFDQVKRGFNTLYDGRKPAAIAQCANPDDVRACVEAAGGRVPVAARSGGHSYAGYSTPDGGLVVDLAKMSQVDVQGDRVVIGAGAKLKDVYAAVGKAGRCLPAGSCPSVGISGLTLGGGLGVMTRKYGLTCDHLVSAQVVTADGQLRTASAESEPDLFWALRGGGGGNFGIVTSFTFSTDPAPAVTVFSVHFPDGTAGVVLGPWQEWIAAAPPELWSNFVLGGGSRVRVGGTFIGTTAQLGRLLDDFVAQTGTRQTSRLVKPMDYLGAMKYFSGSENRQTFVAASRVISEPLAEPKKLVELAKYPAIDLLIDSLGGEVAKLAPADTAFWHRKALGTVQVYSQATAGNAEAATKNVNSVVQGLAGIGATGAYVNYIDPGLPDWMTAYYGGNVPKLREVAKKYDPGKVFGFAQAITPA